MTILKKILLTSYFIFWSILLGLLFIYFVDNHYTNKLYSTARLFLPLIAVLTGLISILTLTALYFVRTDKKLHNKKITLATILPILGIIPLLIFSIIPDTLEEKEETIELSYIAWACDCANWAKIDDIAKYSDSGDTLASLSIFIEPAYKSIELADTLGFSGDVIRFTGRFYTKKGFPKDYQSIEQPDRARVFQYTSYKVIKSNHYDAKKNMEE